MSDILTLKYPKKSHRKKVILPKYSEKLAEFFGIMLGDGGINNDWQATITVNSEADVKYSIYVTKLCKELFGILPAVRKRKIKKALVISLASTSVVDFLVEHGLSRGNKLKNGLRMPDWILSKKKYRYACIRGLVDTDGCIYIHKHTVRGKTYRNIGLAFTSLSPELIFQMLPIFEESGIMPHIASRGKDIRLYQADSVLRYLKIFGTSNSRIKSVYEKWRDARAV